MPRRELAFGLPGSTGRSPWEVRVRIQNTSDQRLSRIRVSITAPSGDQRTCTHGGLDRYEVFEVGWKGLGGWSATVAQAQADQQGVGARVPASGYDQTPRGGWREGPPELLAAHRLRRVLAENPDLPQALAELAARLE